jgi:hypothetical protein
MDSKTIALGLVIGLILGAGIGYGANTSQLSGYQNQLTSLQLQVNILQSQINSKNNEIANLNQQIVSLKSQLPSVIYSTYTAEQIFNDYYANSVAADQKYKYHTFYVKGIISDIETSFSDYPEITLKPWVVCEFEKSHSTMIAGLRIGQEVVIFGNCQGHFISVLLQGCSFFKIYS